MGMMLRRYHKTGAEKKAAPSRKVVNKNGRNSRGRKKN